ncbi:hypothetical protein [Dinghuibacter silviterrae]|uniref:Immunity protein 49 of polymorphic toxin system n=1 Tax=Dinghuibacter silviterrae TaxID=1539049 RepID=A0A4R8DH46_9BACT|nr:hypothetical protein [Dinghuibacter silviterrae]TDW96817.1 hypothetical protein EDB95_4653 [Dinghuibacter silviterrae]
MNSTEQKVSEVTHELDEWLKKPNATDFYFNEPVAEVRKVLEEPKLLKSILVDFMSLNTWYGYHFIYNALAGAKVNGDQTNFAGNAYYTAAIAAVFAQGYAGNPPKIQFTDMTFWLAACLHARWYEESGRLIRAIDRELGTKFLKGGLNFSKAGWFIVQVANKGFGLTIDTAKFNYPKDMGVYRNVLDNWDTADTEIVDKMVSTLCDYHLSQAYFNEDNSPEFSNLEEYVYVYEVLAWLSVRDRKGLRNPGNYTHPLMQLAVNKLPDAPLPFAKMELGETILGRLKEEFPAAAL